MVNSIKNTVAPKVNVPKAATASMPLRSNPGGQYRETPLPAAPTSPIKDNVNSLIEAAAVVQQIRLNAQQELEMARKMRADALRYQQETATKARSEAQQLILKARIATQRDIEELIRKASDEIQKVLADVRVIRITAQEELAAQRKFADAAKLNTMSLALKKDMAKTEVKRKKQLTAAK